MGTLAGMVGSPKGSLKFSLEHSLVNMYRLHFGLTLERKVPYASDFDSTSNSIANVNQPL